VEQVFWKMWSDAAFNAAGNSVDFSPARSESIHNGAILDMGGAFIRSGPEILS